MMKTELGLVQKLTRLYTFYSPVRKGKHRLALASLRLEKDLPGQIVARTRDGRLLKVNFDNHFAYFVYFLGEYEPAITNIVKRIVKPGDVCFDFGGNIGWYTTLLQKLVGPAGAVHSFEPVPPTFQILKENVRANENAGAVRLNNLAAGAETGRINLHLFDDLPDGHASQSDFGKTDYRIYDCPVTTVNEYLKKNQIDRAEFVKVDIEGAELMLLQGATDFFRLKRPPIFEIEMALATTRGFGYQLNEIIEFIRGLYDYEFYVINEQTGGLEKFEKFDSGDIGANVLCVPAGHYRDRLAGFLPENR